MTDALGLVERVANGENGSAASELVGLGAASVSPVAEALRSATGTPARRLRDVLISIRDREAVPQLVDLMDEQSMELVMGVFRALGGSGDRRAVSPLSAYATDDSNRETRRALAVEALGDLADTDVATAATAIAKEAEEEYLPRLLADAVTALAKLGSQELAPGFLRVCRKETDPTVLVHYAKTLKHIVAPGLLSALVEVVRRGDDPDTAREAVRGLQYLGSREAAGVLAEATSEDVASEALFAFHAVTGADLPDDPESAAAQEWWKANGSRFEPGIVYRLGKPLQVGDLIPRLDEARQPQVILDDST